MRSAQAGICSEVVRKKPNLAVWLANDFPFIEAELSVYLHSELNALTHGVPLDFASLLFTQLLKIAISAADSSP